MCGGRVGSPTISSREVWNLGRETLAWKRLPDLTHSRSAHACCVVRGGTLVALGGWDIIEGAPISNASVEVLERAAEEWRELPLLSCGRRQDLFAVAVEESGSVEGQVCILGGVRGAWGEVLDEGCIVDLATGVCTPQPGLSIPRTDMASVRLPDGCIIVAGGWSDDGAIIQDSAEVWEPSRGAWRELEEMGTRRCSSSCCMLSDSRFAVFGGSGGQGDIDECRAGECMQSAATPKILDGAVQAEPRLSPS